MLLAKKVIFLSHQPLMNRHHLKRKVVLHDQLPKKETTRHQLLKKEMSHDQLEEKLISRHQLSKKLSRHQVKTKVTTQVYVFPSVLKYRCL